MNKVLFCVRVYNFEIKDDVALDIELINWNWI